MTKTIFFLLLGVLFFIYPCSTEAQKFTFGEYTGVNFSNLHGNLTSNKWESKAGPTTGLFLEYKLGRLFAVQSEIGFISQYYEMKTYEQLNYYPIGIPYSYLSSYQPISCSIAPPYYELNNSDFSFLRFPLILKYNTPTRLKLGVGGGAFYSVLMNDDITKEERNKAEKEDRTIYPPTHDWGCLFTADLSYPVTDRLRLFLAGRISFGQEIFIESYKAKNGASELLIGIKYSPRQTQNKNANDFEFSEPADSSFTRCYLKPAIGAVISWNSGKKLLGDYTENYGANAGIIFGYCLDKTVSLQSGFQYQQKGYSFSGISQYKHRYATDIKISGNRINSQVNFDYLMLPLSLNFSFEKRQIWYFDLGMFAGFMLNASCTGTSLHEYQNGNTYRLEKYILHDAIEGYYKNVDWGYSAGFGFQFPIQGNTKLDIGLHYQQGLKNMLKKPGEYEFKGIYDDRTFRNNSLSLQVGLQIPIHN